MRLIDADALLKKKDIITIWHDGNRASVVGIVYEDDIEEAPTVDAVPVVHGEWQWISSTYDRTPCEMKFRCSICHHEVIRHNAEPWEHYCPNCGAKMDGKEQDDE